MLVRSDADAVCRLPLTRATTGTLQLEPVLRAINEQISRFEPLSAEQLASVQVPDEQRFTAPQSLQVTGPVTPGRDIDEQYITAVSILCNPIMSVHRTFELSFLSSLLIHGPNAPFHEALIQPNIGQDYSPGTGYCNYTREGSFSVGLQGLKKHDIPRVHEIITNTFKSAARTPFSRERIDSLLHQIEMEQKHVKGNFGLNIALNLASLWVHGADPLDCLNAMVHVDQLNRDLTTKPSLFQDLIQEYFVDNPHQVWLTMSPDESYAEKETEAESKRLQQLQAALSSETKSEIVESAAALEAHQARKEGAYSRLVSLAHDELLS